MLMIVLLMACSYLAKLEWCLSKLMLQFPVCAVEPIRYLLCVEIKCLPNSLLFSQSKYQQKSMA